MGAQRFPDNGGDRLLTLLQIANASFPTGAFAHSFGFETWVEERVVADAATAANQCRDWLRFGVATGDGVAVVLAHRRTLYDDMAGIEALDAKVGALKVSREGRAASAKTGLALIAACRDVFALEPVARLEAGVQAGRAAGHYAVTYGVATAALGIEERDAVASYLWSGFSNLVSVVARLVPLGQVEVQRIVAGAAGLIEECSELARSRPEEDMGSLMANLDTASMRHERLHTRLCIS